MKTPLISAVVCALLSTTLFAEQLPKAAMIQSKLNRSSLFLGKEDLFKASKEKPKFEVLKTEPTNKVFQPQIETLKEAPKKDGGADPAGGAGISDPSGKFKTMVEAGLILEKSAELIQEEFQDYYLISKETKDLVWKIINNLDLTDATKSSFYHRVIATRDIYLNLNKVDPELHEKIKNNYAEEIRKQGNQLDESAFALPAFSLKGKTYIISKLFDDKEKMNTTQQALILIHEYFMRTMTHIPVASRLELTLQVDVQIFKSLKTQKPDTTIAISLMQAIRKMENEKANVTTPLISKQEALIARLKVLQSQRPVLLSEFTITPEEVWNSPDLSLVKINFENRSPGSVGDFKNTLWYEGAEDSSRYLSAKELAEIEEYRKTHYDKLRASEFAHDRLIFVTKENTLVGILGKPTRLDIRYDYK